jgi:hypothetical protein
LPNTQRERVIRSIAGFYEAAGKMSRRAAA